jgi:hypothetical protein
MADNSQVHTGIWTNWSHGPVYGATLTLSTKYGGVLTAFLAIFVSLTGGFFWNIVSFSIHQINTTEPSQRQDALHYRRQVTLRNSAALPAALQFLRLWHLHRKTSSRPALRLLPVAVLATLTALLFYVSGIFTSYITSVPGNSTIVLGPHCGGYIFTSTLDSYVTYSQLSKMNADTNEAANYARQCYQENPSELTCGTFVRPSLPFMTVQNTSCPFAPYLCLWNPNSALRLDTGLLDSSEDLGINAPLKDRIHFRRVATCAPIEGRPFEGHGNDSVAGPILYMNVGERPLDDFSYTFSYVENLAKGGIGYMLE